jgi:hypothetical protein
MILKPRLRWNDNTKRILKETGWDILTWAGFTFLRRADVSMVKNLRVL